MKTQDLPTDINELHKLINSLQADNTRLQIESKLKDERINQLLARLFGQKREKWSKEEKEHALLFDEIEFLSATSVDSETGEESLFTTVKEHKKSKKRRPKIPDFVPRNKVIHDIDEKDKKCACGCDLVKIGEEVTEKLEIIPPQFLAHQHIRYKYACKQCEGSQDESKPAVRVAPVVNQLIPKAILNYRSLSYLIVQKFCDSLPLYRIVGILQRYGFHISRSTLSNNLIQVYERVKPVIDEILNSILRNKAIEIDETTFQVLKEPGRDNTTKSYMWAFKTVHANSPPEIFYHYRTSRSADYLKELLNDYNGVIITDGWASYNAHLSEMPNITHAGCNVHARRKFKEILDGSKKHKLGLYGMQKYAEIYTLDDEIKSSTNSNEQIIEKRKELILPIMEEMKNFLTLQYPVYTAKSSAGKAIRYFLNNYDKLICFIYNVEVPLDTNGVENIIRNFVVGRKNWLFAGSPKGAEASAGLYTLVINANLCGLNPQTYLEALFKEILDNPEFKPDDWTPKAFASRK